MTIMQFELITILSSYAVFIMTYYVDAVELTSKAIDFSFS
jgi:hypothetical protein